MNQTPEMQVAISNLLDVLHRPDMLGSVIAIVLQDRIEVFSIGLPPDVVQRTLISAAAMNQAYRDEEPIPNESVTLQ